MRKSGLPAVVDENTEVLILGTLPSDMSLAAEQYYANHCRWQSQGQNRTRLQMSFNGTAVATLRTLQFAA